MLTPLPPNDPLLRQPSLDVSLRELRTVVFQQTVTSMLEYVYGANNKGVGRDNTRPSTVGLSANQIGIHKRISIVDLAIGQKKFHDIHVLINPRIIWHSTATDVQSEGCVNLPTIWGLVPRWREVEVSALDRSGNKLTIRAKGWAARLLQHEIDHLDGHLFIDHLPDPSKAHKVGAGQMVDYNKKVNRLTWPHYINVEHLIIHEATS
jgi:peptide deformylase